MFVKDSDGNFGRRWMMLGLLANLVGTAWCSPGNSNFYKT